MGKRPLPSSTLNEELTERAQAWQIAAQSVSTETPMELLGAAFTNTALDVTPIRAFAGRALRILVVDDNQDMVDSLAILLRIWGYQVETAYDGASGLAMARSFSPHVVLLDIALPGRLDGLAVARHIRQLHNTAPLMVAISGYGQEQDRRQAQEAGFDHHLLKPFGAGELQDMLERYAQRRGL